MYRIQVCNPLARIYGTNAAHVRVSKMYNYVSLTYVSYCTFVRIVTMFVCPYRIVRMYAYPSVGTAGTVCIACILYRTHVSRVQHISQHAGFQAHPRMHPIYSMHCTSHARAYRMN
jgi:hypothetical protein